MKIPIQIKFRCDAYQGTIETTYDDARPGLSLDQHMAFLEEMWRLNLVDFFDFDGEVTTVAMCNEDNRLQRLADLLNNPDGPLPQEADVQRFKGMLNPAGLEFSRALFPFESEDYDEAYDAGYQEGEEVGYSSGVFDGQRMKREEEK